MVAAMYCVLTDIKMIMKTIKFYKVSQSGCEREFIHPSNAGDAQIIRQLTGQNTITGVVRELIRDLSGGQISFEQTFPTTV